MRRQTLIVVTLLAAAACARQPEPPKAALPRVPMTGPLIAATVSMKAAWEFPRNPLDDTTLDTSRLSEEIRRGFRLFTNTPAEAPRLAPGGMACTNCHMNAGQRERSMPLVDVAGMFPEYNRRSGRLYSLGDRITDCFLRSENATGALAPGELPNPSSPEVLAISAYITWLARDAAIGKNPSWRGQNTIPASALVPLEKLDMAKGEAVYTDRCATCHGPDGQGVQIGDKIAGPLWGPRSWNDGAGAARVYTLAGMIRYSMPYLDPGNITDEDAQHVAAFINSKPRPAYPFKDRDYRVEKLPPDAVYYTRLQTKLSAVPSSADLARSARAEGER
ncbi:MAG TPA: c-type cytochrome [Vicinamibacterales bacterium]|nr:c-type cytochrome [Vicinamibacterales bacterium]